MRLMERVNRDSHHQKASDLIWKESTASPITVLQWGINYAPTTTLDSLLGGTDLGKGHLPTVSSDHKTIASGQQ